MIKTGNLGFPRIGAKRELKFALEKYWSGELSNKHLQQTAVSIQTSNWVTQREHGLDSIPSNDFSLYDHVLDTCLMLGAIPKRFRAIEKLKGIDLYFSMARGHQPKHGKAIPAMEMTKWFNTNYHFIVPEINPRTEFKLDAQKPLDTFRLAKSIKIHTRPVLLGPITFLLLSKSEKRNFSPLSKLEEILSLYADLFTKLKEAGADWIQIDEPFLAADLTDKSLRAYLQFFSFFGNLSNRPKILLTAYFGNMAVNQRLICQSPFEGLHIDMINCPDADAILANLSEGQSVSLGLIDGRNIWKKNITSALDVIKRIYECYHLQNIILSPSCSLMHIPLDLHAEKHLKPIVSAKMSFAVQKLDELSALKKAVNSSFKSSIRVNRSQILRQTIHSIEQNLKNKEIYTQNGYHRSSPYAKRKQKQAAALHLPILPTTTIGSFPQTSSIRRLRSRLQKEEITLEEYESFLKEEIQKAVHLQEEIGLDVLVHGEFERNDMVQYFAEKLEGFAFTEQGWVQSFGSRCVRPPIIFADVCRPVPMTVTWAAFAQSLTSKPVKGMLTGPVTILQWSFVRDDQPRAVTCQQIASAIQAEVLDLERAGIRIIQIDEPALREGLPIQKKDWAAYLDWATACFRKVSYVVQDATQIHTHMCYAEFNDMIDAIARLDADVISIEASRSGMRLLDAFRDFQYPNEIGPGVYDIHSPIVPESKQIVKLIRKALQVIPAERLWINPDCGLKTRLWDEVVPALENMVKAARQVRKQINQ